MIRNYGTLLVASFLLSACEPEILSTEIVLSRSGQCKRDGRAALANTYLAEIYQVNGDGDVGVACGNCLEEGRCELVERSCRCTGQESSGALSVQGALADLRFGNLDEGKSHCVRVLALRVPEQTGTELEECICEPEWNDQVWLSANAAMCGRSAPEGLSASLKSIFVRIHCPDDVSSEVSDPFGLCLEALEP